MHKSVKEKNPLVDIIKVEMVRQGVKNASELARIAKVPQSVVSRFFSGQKGLSWENLYLLLSCLGLVREQSNNTQGSQVISMKRRQHDLLKHEIKKQIDVDVDEVCSKLLSAKDRKVRDFIFKVMALVANTIIESEPSGGRQQRSQR